MTRLTPSNPRIEWLSEPVQLVRVDHGRYERLFFGNDAMIDGGCFRAHADDFPSGTRIRVVAEVVKPGDE